MLFAIFSLRYERGATMLTRNLPFNEGTAVLGSERLTAARLDRRTHPVPILEMYGESYRLKESKRNRPGKPACRSQQTKPCHHPKVVYFYSAPPV